MEKQIESKLRIFIATEILKQPDREIKTDEPLLTSGLIDSFSLVDLAVFIEDELGVRIEDSELNSSIFDSIEQLTELIKNRMN